MSNKFLDAALRYIDLGFSVVILGKGSKEPITKHTPNGLKDATRDPDVVREWWTTTPKCNVGAVLGAASGGIVAIDIDRKHGVDGYEAMRDWEMEHGDMPETVTCCTPTGGFHLYYRVDREIRPSTNDAIGVDIRGDDSYVVLPPSVHPDTDTEYVWEVSPEAAEIAEANELVYQFIDFVRPRESDDDGAGQDEEADIPQRKVGKGGRNAFLFRHGRSIRSRGADDAMVAAYLTALNDEKCEPPIDVNELRKTIKSVCSVKPGLSDEAKQMQANSRGRPRKFDHEKIAKKLIVDNGACFVDGVPAIRHGNAYATGWNAVNREIINLCGSATRSQQREVQHYLTVMAEQKRQSRAALIAFRNGILDIETMEFRDWMPDDVILNIIPHDWNPNALCPEVDNILCRMACGDSDVLENLMEVMGVCMYRSAEFAQSAILLGEGSNGKSTYGRMLMSLLGRENISSLDLASIGKQFLTGQLAGKLANIGNDISSEFQNGDTLAKFRAVVDGNRINADVKGVEGFDFEPYATLIFDANEFPRLRDYTDGMMRRLFPIEFNAKFSKSDPDYDPRIAQKVTTEEACEHMCVLGVMGLQQVFQNNGFTPNHASSRRVEEIKADNDSTYAWAIENGYDADSLDGWVIGALYDKYVRWCEESGLKNTSRTKFTRQMNKNFDMESTSQWRNGKSQNCFQKA